MFIACVFYSLKFQAYNLLSAPPPPFLTLIRTCVCNPSGCAQNMRPTMLFNTRESQLVPSESAVSISGSLITGLCLCLYHSFFCCIFCSLFICPSLSLATPVARQNRITKEGNKKLALSITERERERRIHVSIVAGRL